MDNYLNRILMSRMLTFLLYSSSFFTLCYAQSAVAQHAGIQFKKLNWEQALDVAKKENKFLFVDVYSKNRNAQRQNEFESDHFQVDSVAAFFNSNFISIRVDMGAEENSSFAPNLQSLMYPVYLFLGENGDQIGFISPYTAEKTPSKLMEFARVAIAKGLVKRNNTKKIIFEKLTWDQAKAKAKKENKLIFFDAYTNWCRPCVQMDKDIFTLDKVADFFNKNFINIKTNSEQGEGVAIKEKYKINAFPTFLFTDAKGDAVAHYMGYKDENSFLKIAKDALSKYRYKSIDFIVQDLEKAKQRAQKEEKLIFFDAYTTWCGPCKQMSKDVFTQYDIAKYYNDGYVNVKYDMEKGEGVSLKSKYEITAFPTYLILDTNGNILHRMVGSVPAKDFKQFGETGKSKSNLSTMKADYEAGKNDPDFVLRYIDVLKKAGLGKEMNKVADAYFVRLDKSERISKSTWDLIDNYILTANTEAIKYVVKNKTKFTDLVGDKVDAKLYNVYFRKIYKFTKKDEKGKPIGYDEKELRKYLKQVKKLSLKKYGEFEAYAWINSYAIRKDWKNYIDKINEYMSAKIIDNGAFSVYNYALTIASNCKDTELRKKAWKWLYSIEDSAPDGYKSAIDELKKKLIDTTSDE